jgi:hypothetical protein
MVAKCANPECSRAFRYLCQGRLFVAIPSKEATLDNSIHYAWLCHGCAAKLTVQFKQDGVFEVVPLDTAGKDRDRNPQSCCDAA